METTKDVSILLSQWQTCVEMADSVSQRRDATNNIFVTLNLAIMAAASFAWSIKSVFVLLIGIALCILWARLIKNYKMLNAQKFKVILELEKSLPSQPFGDEWKQLKDNKKYNEFTKLEGFLPLCFVVVHVIALIVIGVNKFYR